MYQLALFADMIAKGGHGAVYKATDATGAPIAIKVFEAATGDAAKREIAAVRTSRYVT